MLDLLIIFCAKYLIGVSALVGAAAVLTLPREERLRALTLIAISFPLTYLFAEFASSLYYHPRPFVTQDFTPLVYHPPTNGFPSSHTLLASAIAAAVYPYQRRVGLLLAAVALAVGLGRVYAGVHSPLDIAASMVIASLITLGAYRVLRRFGRA